MAGSTFAQAIRGIDQGFREAGAAKRAMQEDERRAAIAERDDKRFAWESADAERKQTKAQAEDSLRQRFAQLEQERQSGTGAFADLVNPNAPVEQAAPRQALSTGDAPADQRDPVSQFIDPKVDARYTNPNAMWDRYYNQLGSLMRESFVNNGDYGRAAMVDSEIDKLRQAGYEPTRRAAVAAAVSGADGPAIEPLLQRAYGTLNDGRQIKDGSVQFDARSGRYSMVVVDPQGKEARQSFAPMEMAGVLMVADPLKVLEWNVGRGDKEREIALDERRTRATETTANASLVRARAEADRAGVEMRGQEIKARQEVIDRMFPNADRTLKLEDSVAMSEAQRQQFAQVQAAEQRMKRQAEALIAVNPQLDPRIAGQIVRNPDSLRVDGTENGRPYTTVGSQKVFLR